MFGGLSFHSYPYITIIFLLGMYPMFHPSTMLKALETHFNAQIFLMIHISLTLEGHAVIEGVVLGPSYLEYSF